MPPPEPHWTVNSYGYPNPFSASPNAKGAWATLDAFDSGGSYNELKTRVRGLSSHAVESWKAAFEEYGLLYVISGSDQVTFTPAGRQLLDAGRHGREREFLWIGLNLLLRYPLEGPPRAGRRRDYGKSNLLLYWFVYGAILDLNDELWWSELENVLCRVSNGCEALSAIEDIQRARGGQTALQRAPVSATGQEAFYNVLNQVINHAGMNDVLLTSSTTVGPHQAKAERRVHLDQKWRGLLSLALDKGTPPLTTAASPYVNRMPTAYRLSSEDEYFTYLGAPVAPIPSVLPGHAESLARLVHILPSDTYRQVSDDIVEGSIDTMCRLGRDESIVLGHDLERSYMVDSKQLVSTDLVQVRLRRGRPVRASTPLVMILEPPS